MKAIRKMTENWILIKVSLFGKQEKIIYKKKGGSGFPPACRKGGIAGTGMKRDKTDSDIDDGTLHDAPRWYEDETGALFCQNDLPMQALHNAVHSKPLKTVRIPYLVPSEK
ncbi:hypothetical protein C818_02651 [Lachnospiraceae bacterium MD308]|nr:hypothetical protein C818_02651 [Lachnospiraceae bacterium MD308]